MAAAGLLARPTVGLGTPAELPQLAVLSPASLPTASRLVRALHTALTLAHCKGQSLLALPLLGARLIEPYVMCAHLLFMVLLAHLLSRFTFIVQENVFSTYTYFVFSPHFSSFVLSSMHQDIHYICTLLLCPKAKDSTCKI